MEAQKQSPELAGTSGPGFSNTSQPHHNKPTLKWKRVLAALASGQTLNRFEAERELSDHCLHSTVSVLQGKGIIIQRRNETVPGYQQIPTHVVRYWLAPESRDRACELLGQPAAFERGAGHG